MSDVLDLGPRLSARRRSECKHDAVTVDSAAASLECDDCGAQIDPWWYLRETARQGVDVIAHAYQQAREVADALNAQIAKHNEWTKSANETIKRYNAEVAALNDVKNRLVNETVNGVRLGSAVKRRRKVGG